jgi:ABC-2 type transport system permease protein
MECRGDESTLMLFKEYSPVLANRIARSMLDGYLNGRSQENEAEVPVMFTERHGYLRAKGPHALYALQDIIGKDKVHQALRNFQRDFGFQTSPCPTSRDLVNALRAEAPPNISNSSPICSSGSCSTICRWMQPMRGRLMAVMK